MTGEEKQIAKKATTEQKKRARDTMTENELSVARKANAEQMKRARASMSNNNTNSDGSNDAAMKEAKKLLH